MPVLAWLSKKLRQAFLRTARAVHRAVARSPAAPVLDLSLFERLRPRFRRPMRGSDVLDVLDLLQDAGIKAWVAGGWGIDALVGRQTREHGDLDLVVEAGHEQQAWSLLARRGFGPIKSAATLVPHALLPQRLVLQDQDGRVVDIHPVDLAGWPDSAAVIRERSARSTSDGRLARRDAFAEGEIDGRLVGCLAAWLQLAGHEGYELTDAERRDVVLLSERLES